MNIGIAKIGQKVFFNRNAKEIKRSNTNGNFGCYRLLSLLFELNKKDMFYFFSKNDLCIGSYDNVFPFVANPKDLDCIILIPGLVLSEDDVYTLNEISNCKCKLVILSDDPRCLRETLKNLNKRPDFIGMQNNDFVYWNNKVLDGFYVPLEMAQNYKFKRPIYFYKQFDFTVIANDSGDRYNRIKILSELIPDIDVNIYGRISDEQKAILGKNKCRGEVEYSEMQHILSKTLATLLIPIEKNLVTSKYIEAIQNRVIPIFHKDYNVNLLGLTGYPLLVSNNEQLKGCLKTIKSNPYFVTTTNKVLYSNYVEPYIDGTKLNEIIKEIVRG